MIVDLKDYPRLKNQVLRAVPTYRKHKAIIVFTTGVEMHDTFWDGGSRSSYSFFNTANGTQVFAPQYAPPQFGGPRVAPRMELVPGTLGISTGIFNGKTATATVFLHPDDKEVFGLQ
jgi:hypothetical protein